MIPLKIIALQILLDKILPLESLPVLSLLLFPIVLLILLIKLLFRFFLVRREHQTVKNPIFYCPTFSFLQLFLHSRIFLLLFSLLFLIVFLEHLGYLLEVDLPLCVMVLV